jgi:hypothetical protein
MHINHAIYGIYEGVYQELLGFIWVEYIAIATDIVVYFQELFLVWLL